MHPADAFLAALGKSRATWQLFADAEDRNERPIILHGPHRAQAKRLQAANDRGMGIFAMIADGDLQGRKAENVTAITAYFVDLDGTPMPDAWPAPPTLVIESSPGRYHAYWRVTNAPLDVFPHTQRHLALLMDGDESVHDLPRVMRVPGYAHRKREPFTTRILEATNATYDHQDFADRVALPPERKRTPLPPEARSYLDWKRNGNRPNTQRDPLDTATQRIAAAPEGNRNNTLYKIACAVANDIRDGRTTRDDAEQALADAAQQAGLPDHETQRTLTSALRHAT